ncbi:unnamed protein product [Macrosiphum euphorbiae]|uniref:Uncharacterized protein n=1 Tax=Macrosiphum euphorbiae TaxID=13131 RepID=A0AAV0Y7X5_9HEMI|nr:unnamed protein product [Macrosiphum euphorbiae]
MVETTLESLKQFSRSSLIVYEAAKKFSNWANNYFDHENIKITVQDNFPEIKISKSKIMDGDPDKEYSPPSAYQNVVVDVYNVTFDTLINSMEIRYFSNSKFPADCAFLQPSRFNEKIPEEAFTKLVEHLVNRDESITKANLLYELQDFYSKWDRLKLTLHEEYGFDNFIDEEQQLELKESINNSNLEIEKKSSILCNKIKAIRNSLSHDHLESFMLMSAESDILMALDNEIIIDTLSQKSSNLNKLLNMYN